MVDAEENAEEAAEVGEEEARGADYVDDAEAGLNDAEAELLEYEEVVE